jgi:hypothetical protein
VHVDHAHGVSRKATWPCMRSVISWTQSWHGNRALGAIKQQKHPHPGCGRSYTRELAQLGAILACDQFRLWIARPAYRKFDDYGIMRAVPEVDAPRRHLMLPRDVAVTTLKVTGEDSISTEFALTGLARVCLNQSKRFLRRCFDFGDVYVCSLNCALVYSHKARAATASASPELAVPSRMAGLLVHAVST